MPSCTDVIFVATAPDTTSLGKSGLKVSSLGIGTLQWGDTQCGFGKQYDDVSNFAHTGSADHLLLTTGVT